MKKIILTVGVFIGLVALTGSCHAVSSEDKDSQSSSAENTLDHEKIVIQEEQAMAVIPDSSIEAEKLKLNKQSKKEAPEEEEKKAKIPDS